jgi:hypothetical protein
VSAAQECRRGQDCTERIPVYGPGGVRTGWTPAHTDDALCGGCRRTLAYALDELPRQVLAVEAEQLPKLAIIYRQDDCSGGGEIHAPIPLDTHLDAIVRLIDHEVCTWADFVADAMSLPWSAMATRMSRTIDRVTRGSILLRRNTSWLLALGPHEYRARSLGENPWSGQGRGVVVRRDGTDFWVERDGPAAAIRILELFRATQEATGQIATTRLRTPCRHCHCRTLNRDHTRNLITCSTCGNQASVERHEQDERNLIATAGRVAS